MDLISQLADAIVALNNASPRLPTKTEIEEVLRSYQETRNPIMPLPYKDVSPALMQLIEQARNDIKKAYFPELEKNALYARLKGKEAYEKQVARIFNDLPGFNDMAPTIAVGHTDQPCRGSTDGSHLWYAATSRIPNGAFRCACGARKPA